MDDTPRTSFRKNENLSKKCAIFVEGYKHPTNIWYKLSISYTILGFSFAIQNNSIIILIILVKLEIF